MISFLMKLDLKLQYIGIRILNRSPISLPDIVFPVLVLDLQMI